MSSGRKNWSDRKKQIGLETLQKLVGNLRSKIEMPPAFDTNKTYEDNVVDWVGAELARLRRLLEDQRDKAFEQKLRADRAEAEIRRRDERMREFGTMLKEIVKDCVAIDKPKTDPNKIAIFGPCPCNKIVAIKTLREVSGLGLKEAKDHIDALPARQEVPFNPRCPASHQNRTWALQILRAAGVECE